MGDIQNFSCFSSASFFFFYFLEACCIVLYFEAKAKVFLRFHVALCMAGRGRCRGRGSQHCVA